MTLWQVSTKKLMTKLTNKIIASLYEKAHKLKLQKNPAKSNQDGLETSTLHTCTMVIYQAFSILKCQKALIKKEQLKIITLVLVIYFLCVVILKLLVDTNYNTHQKLAIYFYFHPG